MIKIAFFDVDGTLLKRGCKEPSENTIKILKALRERGVIVCMATGRSYSIIPHFNDFEFDVWLTFNGSYVLNKDNIIFTNPLDNEDKEIIINNLINMNRPIAMSNENCLITNDLDPEGRFRKYFASEYTDEELINKFEEVRSNTVYQIMCHCESDEYDTILKGTTHTKMVSWLDGSADIIPLDGGKGRGVEEVLKYYNISKEDAIAFGDGMNDIEMFQEVGISVAMGNAKDSVKAHASAVCASVDEDGIYNYFVENNLI